MEGGGVSRVSINSGGFQNMYATGVQCYPQRAGVSAGPIKSNQSNQAGGTADRTCLISFTFTRLRRGFSLVGMKNCINTGPLRIRLDTPDVRHSRFT